MGEYPSNNREVYAEVAPLGSHCVGLYAPKEGEVPGATSIRTKALQLFRQWGRMMEAVPEKEEGGQAIHVAGQMVIWEAGTVKAPNLGSGDPACSGATTCLGIIDDHADADADWLPPNHVQWDIAATPTWGVHWAIAAAPTWGVHWAIAATPAWGVADFGIAAAPSCGVAHCV